MPGCDFPAGRRIVLARMRIMKLTGDSRKGALEALLGRSPAGYSEYEETVRQIIEDVRARGDEAVFELEEKFDRCRLDRDSIRVSRQEIEEAYLNNGDTTASARHSDTKTGSEELDYDVTKGFRVS